MNPAPTGPALFAGSEYIAQLWLFWLAPLLGAIVAGLLARWLYEPAGIIENFSWSKSGWSDRRSIVVECAPAAALATTMAVFFETDHVTT